MKNIIKFKNGNLRILSPLRYNRKLKKGNYYMAIINLYNNEMKKEGLSLKKIYNYYWYLMDSNNKFIYECEIFHSNNSETFIINDLERYLTVNKKLDLIPRSEEEFKQAMKILYNE